MQAEKSESVLSYAGVDTRSRQGLAWIAAGFAMLQVPVYFWRFQLLLAVSHLFPSVPPMSRRILPAPLNLGLVLGPSLIAIVLALIGLLGCRRGRPERPLFVMVLLFSGLWPLMRVLGQLPGEYTWRLEFWRVFYW